MQTLSQASRELFACERGTQVASDPFSLQELLRRCRRLINRQDGGDDLLRGAGRRADGLLGRRANGAKRMAVCWLAGRRSVGRSVGWSRGPAGYRIVPDRTDLNSWLFGPDLLVPSCSLCSPFTEVSPGSPFVYLGPTQLAFDCACKKLESPWRLLVLLLLLLPLLLVFSASLQSQREKLMQ